MHILNNYRPQRSWGKVIFSEVCVNNSVHRGACMVAQGGMCGCTGGVCVVLFGGACIVLFGGGGHVWFYLGGMHGFIWGACVVLFGGCAWFYSGGCAWFFQFFRIQLDTVNERAVRILLECILVELVFSLNLDHNGIQKRILCCSFTNFWLKMHERNVMLFYCFSYISENIFLPVAISVKLTYSPE